MMNAGVIRSSHLSNRHIFSDRELTARSEQMCRFSFGYFSPAQLPFKLLGVKLCVPSALGQQLRMGAGF